MKKVFIIGILMIFVLFAGCSNKEVKTTESVEGAIKENQTLSAFGIIKSADKKDIYIDFPAVIERMNIKDGQKVNRGEVLFSINFDSYLNEINSKKVELKSLILEQKDSRLELEKLKKNLSQLQECYKSETYPELSKLKNNLQYAKKVYEQSLDKLKSLEELFKADIISGDELDSFRNKTESDKKAVEEIEFSIESIKYNLKNEIDDLKSSFDQKREMLTGDSNTDIYEEKVKVLKSTIKLMEDKLNQSFIVKNNIVSDMDNAIAYGINYANDETIDAEKKVLSLMSYKSLRVEATVPEGFIKDIRLGAKVTVVPLADKSRRYQGKIIFIANNAELVNGETNVNIQTSIDNNDGFLQQNFNVNIEIDI